MLVSLLGAIGEGPPAGDAAVTADLAPALDGSDLFPPLSTPSPLAIAAVPTVVPALAAPLPPGAAGAAPSSDIGATALPSPAGPRVAAGMAAPAEPPRAAPAPPAGMSAAALLAATDPSPTAAPMPEAPAPQPVPKAIGTDSPAGPGVVRPAIPSPPGMPLAGTEAGQQVIDLRAAPQTPPAQAAPPAPAMPEPGIAVAPLAAGAGIKTNEAGLRSVASPAAPPGAAVPEPAAQAAAVMAEVAPIAVVSTAVAAGSGSIRPVRTPLPAHEAAPSPKVAPVQEAGPDAPQPLPVLAAPTADDQPLGTAARPQPGALAPAPPPVASAVHDLPPGQVAAALPGSLQGPPLPEGGAAPTTMARHAPREAEAAMRQIVAPITTLAAAGADGATATPRTVTLALHPVELGRVALKVEKRADGRLSIGVAAERADTLALLRADQGVLDRALTQAGLPPENRSINFDLAGNGAWGGGTPQQQAGMESRGGRQGRAAAGPGQAGIDPSPAGIAAAPQRQAAATGRLDISI